MHFNICIVCMIPSSLQSLHLHAATYTLPSHYVTHLTIATLSTLYSSHSLSSQITHTQSHTHVSYPYSSHTHTPHTCYTLTPYISHTHIPHSPHIPHPHSSLSTLTTHLLSTHPTPFSSLPTLATPTLLTSHTCHTPDALSN